MRRARPRQTMAGARGISGWESSYRCPLLKFASTVRTRLREFLACGGFHSGANLSQVAPPSVVCYEPFVSDTVAPPATTDVNLRMSSCTVAPDSCQDPA